MPPSKKARCTSLPPLPYAENALEPVVSAKTIGFHYGKHHKAYVDNLNKLIAGTELASLSLEKIIAATAGKADKVEIFNNAAQAWNHDFYWRSMRPEGRRRAARGAEAMDRDLVHHRRRLQEGARDRGDEAIRQRLGVARAGARQAQGRQHRQCGQSADEGRDAAARPSTSGSTRTTSTTRTGAPITSTPCSTS